MAEQPTADSVRAEIRAWLEDTWDPDRPLAEWREMLADSMGMSDLADRVLGPRPRSGAWRRGDGGVPPNRCGGSGHGVAMTLVAPTLLAHGSDELKARLLRPILTGQDTSIGMRRVPKP